MADDANNARDGDVSRDDEDRTGRCEEENL